MDKDEALAEALDQIMVAFGKEGALTPEQRIKRAQRRIDHLLNVRIRLNELAWAEAAKDRDEQGWTELEPPAA